MDDRNWMFKNGEYTMMVYYRYGELHAITKQYAKRRQGYIFDYGIHRVGDGLKGHVQNCQFVSFDIKSELTQINNIGRVMSSFLKDDYCGQEIPINKGCLIIDRSYSG